MPHGSIRLPTALEALAGGRSPVEVEPRREDRAVSGDPETEERIAADGELRIVPSIAGG